MYHHHCASWNCGSVFAVHLQICACSVYIPRKQLVLPSALLIESSKSVCYEEHLTSSILLSLELEHRALVYCTDTSTVKVDVICKELQWKEKIMVIICRESARIGFPRGNLSFWYQYCGKFSAFAGEPSHLGALPMLHKTQVIQSQCICWSVIDSSHRIICSLVQPTLGYSNDCGICAFQQSKKVII